MKKLLLLTAGLVTASLVNAQSHYKISDRIKVDGEGGWDYVAVDENTNRLYVSHSTVVVVIDLSTNKTIATIPDTKGVHGIAIASDLNKGFISDGHDSTVTVFDLKTNATITKIQVTGANPDAILYEPSAQRVFTFNGRSNNSTVIDAKTLAVIGTIALPGRPEFAVADGTGKVFFNLEDKGQLCRMDAKSMKVEDTLSLAPGEGPSGLAIDTKTRRLFSVCDNKMMVIIDIDKWKVLTTVPTGDRTDAAAFDTDKKIIYSSNGDGTLTAVKEGADDKFTVLENVATQKSARTCAVNSKTHHIYLPAAEFGSAPEKTAENPHPRPAMKPGTFVILDVVPVE